MEFPTINFEYRRVFINPGRGCPYDCSYCYLKDYGTEDPPKVVEFSGDELYKKLVNNKNFIKGKYGSAISFSPMSDPFYPPFREKTLELLEKIAVLENPIQIVTKTYVDTSTAKKIQDLLVYDNQLTFMITITSFSHWKSLEPNLVPPEKRIQTLKNFEKAGIPVCLNIKPIIPGITDKEIKEFKRVIKENKIRECNVGDLYLNKRILKKLEERGVLTEEIKSRIKTKGSKRLPWDREGITYELYSRDIINNIVDELKDLNIPIFRRSICAIAYNLKIPCPTRVWKLDKESCTNCQDCNGLYNNLPSNLKDV